jgi:hypothetical protein
VEQLLWSMLLAASITSIFIIITIIISNRNKNNG